VVKVMGISKGSANKVWQEFIKTKGSNNGLLMRGQVTRKKVKRARLTRMEIVAVVLYTGTLRLLASDSSECVLR